MSQLVVQARDLVSSLQRRRYATSGRTVAVGSVLNDRAALQQEHRVAVAVETIFVADRFVIGAADQIVAAEGADEDQQRGPRQMKVREQGIDCTETIGRPDK